MQLNENGDAEGNYTILAMQMVEPYRQKKVNESNEPNGFNEKMFEVKEDSNYYPCHNIECYAMIPTAVFR
jgi:hypothetical protein